MTPEQIISILRQQMRQIEHELTPKKPPQSELGDYELVQILPAADKKFGGMLLRGKVLRAGIIEGYLLRPHRGGCRDAWHRAKICDVTPVGKINWPESAWGFREW